MEAIDIIKTGCHASLAALPGFPDAKSTWNFIFVSLNQARQRYTIMELPGEFLPTQEQLAEEFNNLLEEARAVGAHDFREFILKAK